jgi:hypothetical protein
VKEPCDDGDGENYLRREEGSLFCTYPHVAVS